jgi:hypothetical protein
MGADRRSFLRGLVSLPLIGGGVTLIGAPSAPVPLVQAAAMPMLDDPRQRARYAWEAFTSAMREVAAGTDGWIIRGGDRLTPLPHLGLKAGPWITLDGVRYVYTSGSNPRGPAVYEEAVEVSL